MRKDHMMTLVRARPPCNALLAPWCYVMPQGDAITVGKWVPAAASKPLAKLAVSAMRSTPKKAFTVAERNVCALIRSEDSDGFPTAGRSSQNSSLRRLLGRKARAVGGRQRCSWKLHVRSTGPGVCQRRKDSDGRSHSQDGCCGKDDGP